MGKKAVEMGRYGASELMRNKNLQKKAVNYGINKLTPFIQDSVGTAMDQLSTKVRPNKKYETDRKDLDGRSGRGVGGGINPTLQYAFDEAKNGGYKGSIDQFATTTGLTSKLTGGNLVVDPVKFGWDKVAKGAVNKAIQAEKKHQDFVKSGKRQHFVNSWEGVKELGYRHDYFTFYLSLTNKPLGWTMGSGVDIHKQILKVAPYRGITIPGHNYTGPGNPLHDQLRHDDEGNILETYQQPTGPTDAASMQHDVDYSVCGNKPKSEQLKRKHAADKKMVKSLDAIPWKKRQWGHTLARTMINTKQKLGLGLTARRR